jgi:hypothetical protein
MTRQLVVEVPMIPYLSQAMDYFAPAPTEEEAVLRIIKGNFRRQFVGKSMAEDGVDGVPPAWKEHNLSEILRGFLGGQHPRARGGEDLPDLEEGEVEIARMTLADSVHGEVTSLRARRKGKEIAYRIVDEYGTEIELPIAKSSVPLTEEQIIEMFRDCDPSQTETECAIEFQSFFYEDLDEVASKLGAE